MLKRVIKHSLYILLLMSFYNNLCAVDKVKYEVIKSIDDNVELRNYPELLLVSSEYKLKTTDLDTQNMKSISDNLYQSLSAYIKGENDQNIAIEMIIPVLVTIRDNKVVMLFPMPVKFKVSSLPIPNNKDLVVEHLTDQKMIAIKFSGAISEENFQQHYDELLEVVHQNHLNIDPKMVIRAYYSPPFLPNMFKHNEVLIKIH